MPKVDITKKCKKCFAYGHARISAKVCDKKVGNKEKVCEWCLQVGHINPYSIHCLQNPLRTNEEVGQEILFNKVLT